MKPNKITEVGAAADSDMQPIVTTSADIASKPNVMRRFLKVHHKLLLWLFICMAMPFCLLLGTAGQSLTYLCGVGVGYVVWSSNGA